MIKSPSFEIYEIESQLRNRKSNLQNLQYFTVADYAVTLFTKCHRKCESFFASVISLLF